MYSLVTQMWKKKIGSLKQARLLFTVESPYGTAFPARTRVHAKHMQRVIKTTLKSFPF